jgi:two-component sensor histidine kinase/ABC-type amino acid transport substrate-binding protein
MMFMIKQFLFKSMIILLISFSCITAESGYDNISKINYKSQISLSKQELTWLEKHPVIRVVHDPGWPPIEFTDENGEASGMSADYLSIIEQRLGIKFVRVKNLSWQSAVEGLKRQDIDLATSVSVTPARSEYLSFTKPYMSNPIVIATQLDVTYIAGMHELKGKKVALVDGYAIDDWITKDFPDIQLIRVKTALSGLELLQRGEIFAYIDNLLIIGYYQSKMEIAGVKIAGQTPYVNAQCMGIRKDWGILTGIIQKALDSISQTETDKIYRKWLPLRFEHGFNYVLFGRVFGIFTIILLALIFWNRKLVSEIKQKKQAEDKVKNLLNEKEFLLIEVHNRIKNNMNNIKGLLTLQISAEENLSAKASLNDAESRVQSIITLYERLYCTDNYRELPVKDYLIPLTEEIVGSFPNHTIVKIETDIDDFILNVNILTPLGIIINELLTNIMKYAFTGRESGLIYVSASIKDNHVIVTVKDNGLGIPETISFNNTKGFGLDLISMLVEQIGGSIRIERDGGAKFIIKFEV